MPLDDIATIGSLMVAAIALLLSFREHGETGNERENASIERQQMLSDKLSYISDMVSETRDGMRELRQLTGVHERELAIVKQRTRAVEGRVKHLEIRMDDMQGQGSGDDSGRPIQAG